MIFRSSRDRLKYELRGLRDTSQAAVRRKYPNWMGKGSASYRAWSLRQAAASGPDFPDEWRAASSNPLRTPAALAVIAPVPEPDEVETLRHYLAKLPIAFDLILLNTGTATDSDGEWPNGLSFDAPNLRNLVQLDREPLGGDALALVYLANAGLLDPYRLILRTGRLDERTGLGELAPSPDAAAAVVAAFENDSSLGIIAANEQVRGPEGWGDTGTIVREMLARIGATAGYRDLRFADAGSFWIRGFLLQGLRAFGFSRADFVDPFEVDSVPASRAIERLLGLLARESGLRIAEMRDVAGGKSQDQTAVEQTSATVVSLYVPEFFPAPLADRSWGRGFTGWSNYDPEVEPPAPPVLARQIGPYRLATGEVLREQAERAGYAGVASFLVRHYWFAGQTYLDGPTSALLEDPSIDIGFALMWDNADWIRPFLGPAQEVEKGQDFTQFPAADFIDSILPLLRDPRYLKVDGAAVLVVSAPRAIPDLQSTVQTWRIRCAEQGVGDLLVLGVMDEIGGEFDLPLEQGLDGRILLPPRGLPWRTAPHHPAKYAKTFVGRTLSYAALARSALTRTGAIGTEGFPGVMAGYDSSPSRLSDADIWVGANPFTFRRWLARTVGALRHRPEPERLVFVRAWNDWSTGSVIEPTERWGPTYLQAIRDVTGGRDAQ